MPVTTIKDILPPTDSKIVLNLSLALLLAVRCKQNEASRQILATMYHTFSEDQAKTVMNRLIYLLEPQERDWMKAL